MELWKLSAQTIASMVKSGDISAQEVTQNHLERLAAVNPVLNAVVQVCEKDALEAAGNTGKKRVEGQPLGILAGVPVTVKVNID